MSIKSIRRAISVGIPASLLIVGILYLLVTNTEKTGSQQFIYLARSFLDGKLYFTTIFQARGDTTFWQGQYYWPLGPFPAILLVPFVYFFGLEMQQGYVSFVLSLLNLLLLYRISMKINRDKNISIWLSFGYIFGTAYLGVAAEPWSWYFAQVVTTSCLLLALHEYFYKRRWWLLGIFLGLGIATRINTLPVFLFFGLIIFIESNKDIRKTMQLVKLGIPGGLSLILVLLYNYLRFQDPLEFGYTYQFLYTEHALNRAHGMWSLIHFPSNIYYLFLRWPDGVFIPGTKVLTYPYLKPDIWGMSILLTSPMFLWIASAPWKDTLVRLAAITSLSMLFIMLGYYGIGARQYGYRYALDVYPFLFLILAKGTGISSSILLKIVITGSFLINLFLIHLL